MELIRSASRRSLLSEAVYVVLNISYAVMLLLFVVLFDPPYVAFLLVILSKWRTVAVRPRFWLANLQTNLADMFVGLAVVALMWLHAGNLWLQLFILALFIIWLVIIKPRSKRKWIVIQSAIVQFVCLMALFSFGYHISTPLVVVLALVIAYVSAQHILASYNDEPDRTFLAILWGFVVAELAWLAAYWTIAYSVLKIPQISIVVTLIGYLALTTYDNYQSHDGEIDTKELRLPALFVSITIGLLLLLFNGLDPTSL